MWWEENSMLSLPTASPPITQSTWWAQNVAHEQMDMRLLAGSRCELVHAHLTMVSRSSFLVKGLQTPRCRVQADRPGKEASFLNSLRRSRSANMQSCAAEINRIENGCRWLQSSHSVRASFRLRANQLEF